MTIIEFIGGWFERFMFAIVVFMAGFIIGRLLGQLITKIFQDIKADRFTKKIGLTVSIEKNIGKMIKNLIYVLSVIISLNILGVTSIVIMVVSIFFLILFILQFALNINDFLPNLITGIDMRKHKNKWLGKNIKTQNVRGKIVRIGFFETHLIYENENIYLPNRSLKTDVVLVK